MLMSWQINCHDLFVGDQLIASQALSKLVSLLLHSALIQNVKCEHSGAPHCNSASTTNISSSGGGSNYHYRYDNDYNSYNNKI